MELDTRQQYLESIAQSHYQPMIISNSFLSLNDVYLDSMQKKKEKVSLIIQII